MAKASGGTRTKTPNKEYNADGITGKQWDSLVKTIANGDIPDIDLWDELNQEQHQTILMEAGFSGAISDDLDQGQIYLPIYKKDIVAEFQDALVNEMQGYGMDDSTSYTVLYKDGTRKYLSHDMENDFEDTKISVKMPKQSYTNAKNALKISNVAAIIRSDGYGQPRYYVAKGGEQAMRDYGFEFWKGGKGEKKRDYIQDDWI